jgi:hypothetical protein
VVFAVVYAADARANKPCPFEEEQAPYERRPDRSGGTLLILVTEKCGMTSLEEAFCYN